MTNNNLYGLYGFSKGITYAESGDIPWKNYAHPKPGYDGQFYFRLALDPFTDKRKAFGVPLDAPLSAGCYWLVSGYQRGLAFSFLFTRGLLFLRGVF